MRESRPDVRDAEHIDQELGEFEDARRHGRDAIGQPAVSATVRGETGHEGVMVADHRGTRSRRRDDDIVGLERPAEPIDERDAGVLVAGIEVHLAAAGLLGGEFDFVPQSPDEADHRPADLREEQVVVAGDE